MSDKTPLVLLLGPDLKAVSGVSTHLNLLFASGLETKFRFRHFQVGSEGRRERGGRRLMRLLGSPFSLAATLFAERVDIVHLNTSLDRRAYWRDLAYMVVARLSGTHIVYQVHGGALPEKFFKNSRTLTALLRASLSLADVIVVLAQCEFQAYRNFVPGADVRIIPNAIDDAPYAMLHREPSDARSPLRLVYVGRLVRQKGLYEALNGLRLARAQGSAAHLTIAGSGPEEAGLRQAVEQLKLADAVSFVGPVFGQAKLKLLGDAEVLLFPSYAEGLPYALLECMAAGIPAITTRVGAIPDVVFSGVHGIFVSSRNDSEIAQAIAKLAGNRALLAKMSIACRKRIASRYSVQHFSEEFSRLYSEIDSSRRGSTMAGLRDKLL